MGPEGQGNDVIVFFFSRRYRLEGHGNSLVLAAVLTGGLPGRLHGQEPGLGKGNIANGLTFAGEVELLFFLALVFGHGEIIRGGGGGSNGGLSRGQRDAVGVQSFVGHEAVGQQH